MSQRARGYERKALDLYDTPVWVVAALLPHLPGVGAVWEPGPPAAARSAFANLAVASGPVMLESRCWVGSTPVCFAG